MKHPYAELPDDRFWRRAVSGVEAHLIDPVGEISFQIGPQDRVATAGSCFAQHISRALQRSGMHYLVEEQGADLSPAERERRQFGLFSARYGNIYTPAQLRQLLEEAFGRRAPAEAAWRNAAGLWIDPFRPTVEPDGFASEEDLKQDRLRHLAAVRRLIEGLDVLIFTLGLTEAWRSRVDGSVYPVAPGVAGGVYDPEQHEYVNFGAAETEAELRAALAIVREFNPAARMLLTVSPVPLIATYEQRNVITATSYSKAVLRVAAERVASQLDGVDYFPSYEIITGPAAAGRYFEDDLREVSAVGVAHVMRVFRRHYIGTHDAAEPVAAAQMLAESTVVCDEEMIKALRHS